MLILEIENTSNHFYLSLNLKNISNHFYLSFKP